MLLPSSDAAVVSDKLLNNGSNWPHFDIRDASRSMDLAA
jgi:hypothetical protein